MPQFKTLPLSARAATLVFSVVYDARLMGKASSTEIIDSYTHLAHSREALLRYIARMELKLEVLQDTIVRF